MKNYKYIGILVLAWLFTLPATAQLGEERHNFAVGINGGLNMNSVSFDPKIKQNTLNGMEMGVTMRYMSEKYFKMMCGVQMEINYSQRGWSEKIEDCFRKRRTEPRSKVLYQCRSPDRFLFKR